MEKVQKKSRETFELFWENFSKKVEEWNGRYGEELKAIQKTLVKSDEVVKHSIVFNKAMPSSEIKAIIVADNPGYQEQLKSEYLVGSAGEKVKNFIRDKKGWKFEENVVVLNKTPIFTPITKQLTKINLEIRKETQEWMAEEIAKLFNVFYENDNKCELWIIGSGELEKGIFKTFKEKFKENIKYWNKVSVFPHFSRNCFITDFNIKGKSLEKMNRRDGIFELKKSPTDKS
jgi:hypothetical protein